MKSNFEVSLAYVVQSEGGWSDHPDDPGGPTMRGVTLTTFRKFFGKDKTMNELKHINISQLAKIYKRYWDDCKCDELPVGIDYAVFDAAVNSGARRSIKLLQDALGVTVDGIIGPKTLQAASEIKPDALIFTLMKTRLDFLRALHTWGTFCIGWGRRIASVRRQALDMMDKA